MTTYVRVRPRDVAELEAQGWRVVGGHWYSDGASVLMRREVMLRDDISAGEEATPREAVS